MPWRAGQNAGHHRGVARIGNRRKHAADGRGMRAIAQIAAQIWDLQAELIGLQHVVGVHAVDRNHCDSAMRTVGGHHGWQRAQRRRS